MPLTEGNEITLTTEITPVNATNKKVTWQSSNESVATVTEGTVTAIVYPANATTKDVRWSSSNAAVVSVEDGKVTAREPGTAIITVTTVHGEKSVPK